MSTPLSRRALFARFRGGPAQLRPPWSRDEEAFTVACTRCGKCIAACPTGVLSSGHAGYPIVDFARAACNFCGACGDACEADCFERRAGDGSTRRPWALTATIAPACVEAKGVSCRMCEAACEAAAIRFRPRLGGGSLAGISQEQCTGCGACVATCPVKAISIHTHTTAEVPS